MALQATSLCLLPQSEPASWGVRRIDHVCGPVRSIDSDYSDPLVVNVSDGWRITPWMNVLASGAVAEKYQAAGGSAEFML